MRQPPLRVARIVLTWMADMKPLLLIACLFAAAPAWSQTKVYTNADLGQPLSPNRGKVSPEVLASLEAHQFRLPVTHDGPMVVSSGSSSTAGPFGEFLSTIEPRRLDGSSWADPPWQSLSYFPGYYPLPYGHRPYAGRSTYASGNPYATGPSGGRNHGGPSGGGRSSAGSGAPGRHSRGR